MYLQAHVFTKARYLYGVVSVSLLAKEGGLICGVSINI